KRLLVVDSVEGPTTCKQKRDRGLRPPPDPLCHLPVMKASNENLLRVGISVLASYLPPWAISYHEKRMQPHQHSSPPTPPPALPAASAWVLPAPRRRSHSPRGVLPSPRVSASSSSLTDANPFPTINF